MDCSQPVVLIYRCAMGEFGFTLTNVCMCLWLGLRSFSGVEIRRIKDRFTSPTEGGWRDCMINISFVDDPDQHICEVQLIHTKLMLARKGMAGHNDYVTFRSAIELREAVAWQQDHGKDRLRPGSPTDDEDE